MSLTPSERVWMDRSEELTKDKGAFIETYLQDAGPTAGVYGVRLAYDDRFAQFEAALIRFVIESRT